MVLKELKNTIKFTPVPEVNFAYQKVVSFSQYATYTKCPYLWYMKSIKKVVPDEPNLYFCFGTAIHAALEHYFKVMYEESGSKADKEDLEQIFETKFTEEYKRYYDKKGSHFSDAEEMNEFFDDGREIIKFLKKNRNKYFSIKHVHLLGIELPLHVEVKKNLILKSLLDIVLYDEDLDKVYIFDFKTSTRGWGDDAKKDDSKVPQLILYKKYFSDFYNIDINKIDVQYVILKRKIWENSEFPQKRIQIFEPASGKNSINKLNRSFQAFLDDCFDDNGKPIEKEYDKKPSKHTCKYCALLNTVNCKEGIG